MLTPETSTGPKSFPSVNRSQHGKLADALLGQLAKQLRAHATLGRKAIPTHWLAAFFTLRLTQTTSVRDTQRLFE